MSDKINPLKNKIHELCESKYDFSPNNERRRSYIILSSQRTGSTYIARSLCNIKDQFGFPIEYLNPRAVNALIPRIFNDGQNNKNYSIDQYIRAISKLRTSKDGFFGIKVQPNHLVRLFKNQDESKKSFIFEHDYIILLTRKNKLEQSVSNAIATITDEWHPGEKEIIFDKQKKELAYKKITSDILRFFEEEDFILSIGKQSKKPVLHIEYEDIEQDAKKTAENVVKFLSDDKNQNTPVEEKVLSLPIKNSIELYQELKNNYLNYITGKIFSYKK